MTGSAPAFRSDWSATILPAPPLILPARNYIWPMRIAGEEEALTRGALLLLVRPPVGGNFLATCALGFRDPSMLNAVFSCPNPRHLCAVAGGYAYIADVAQPETSTLLAMKPVVAVHAAPQAELLLFIGFYTIAAWSANGPAWETARLSWEGLRITEIGEGSIRGFGWDLMSDKEVAFGVDLATGQHRGGAFPAKI